MWGTDRAIVRNVAVSNGLLFQENESLTLMLHTMRRYAETMNGQ